ncbi:MAG: SDR family NAD(P)-dependent oxidoreductase [Steroidobacteraceae bacterium]
MKLEGCKALVTGANRGLGRAYAQALVAAGAAQVFAGARNPADVPYSTVTPIRLDVTSDADVASAIETCAGVSLLINNAGVMLAKPVLGQGAAEALRREMEVNVFGLHRMMTAFAPRIAAAGGGAIVNVLSVVSLFTAPFNATYCSSKHAAMALTDGARIQLRRQGVHVVGVYAGFIDTDMARSVDRPKASPHAVAERTLDGVRRSQDHVFGDAVSEAVWQRLRKDSDELMVGQQQAWDAGATPWGPAAGASKR